MPTRKLFSLLLIAFLATGLALWLSSDSSAKPGVDAPMFPGLMEQVNDVAALHVVGPNGPLQVLRGDDGWSVDVLGNYPADPAVVRAVILGAAQLTREQAMTSRPASYSKLGVQPPGSTPLDPDAAPGTSGPVSLRLENAEGVVLADFVAGHTRPGKPPALYVRQADDPQAWLAHGELQPPALPVGWVATEFLNMGPERFKRVTITHVDGEQLRVERSSLAETEWAVWSVPAGFKESWTGVGRSVGSALQNLEFETVRGAHQQPWPDDGVTAAQLLGFDGFVVQAETIDLDGRKWTRFSAHTEYSEPLPPEELSSDATEPQSVAPRALEVARRERQDAEAQRFTETHAPWIYALPAWKATNLLKRMADLTKQIEPAAEPPLQPAPLPGDG